MQRPYYFVVSIVPTHHFSKSNGSSCQQVLQCICCTKQNRSAWHQKPNKQTKNPDTLCICWRHVGGTNDC